MKNDDIIKDAAKHYSVDSNGVLSRNSFPYTQYRELKTGQGFDHPSKDKGYLRFQYRPSKDSNAVLIRSHRMVFYLLHGYLPKHLDHIDRNPLNNHPDNLREASHSQNMRNKRSAKGSSSKYVGVSWNIVMKKWLARINNRGSKIHLGYFDNEEDAAEAYNNAALERDPIFINLNHTEKVE